MTTLTKSKTRTFTRYIDFDLGLDATEFAIIGRSHGMQVVDAFRPGLHVTCTVCLHGTAAQMAAVEAEWKARGCDRIRKKHSHAWEPRSVDDPEKWAEVTADWSRFDPLPPIPTPDPSEPTEVEPLPDRGDITEFLAETRESLLSQCDPDCIDERGTWVHFREVMEILGRRDWATAKDRDRAFRLSAEFLSQFATSAACRKRKGRDWRNPGYCPETPWGNYIWHFTLGMVQDLLWLRPAFIEGYLYRGEKDRDGNPHKAPLRAWLSRKASWDHGWIFRRAQTIKVQQWAKSWGER